ncbi:MAG: DUF58 domain-containing protein [Oscillospiraceae bacterium]|nr:DUF58 domain-containing protein [Oscillospiraceae bacterium]
MKKAIFIAAWAASGICALLFGGRYLSQTFYIISAILSLSGIFSLCVYLTLRAGIETDSPSGVTGGQIMLTVAFRNKLSFPIPAVAVNFLETPGTDCIKQYALTLGSHEKKQMRAVVDLKSRGEHEVGVTLWRAWDFFGVFTARRNVNLRRTVTVLPRVISIRDNPPLPPLETDSNTASRSGDLSGARPYVGTDRIKDIHWKLSAKGDELYTKQFTGVKRPPVWVITDLSDVGGDVVLEDKLLESALSLIRFLLESTPVMCAAVNDNLGIMKLKSTREFDDYYQTLGLAEFKGSDFYGTLSGIGMDNPGIAWLVTTGSDIAGTVSNFLSHGWDVKWINVSLEPDITSHDSVRNTGALVQHIPLSDNVKCCAWMCD